MKRPVRDIHRIPRIVLAALLVAYPDDLPIERLLDVVYGHREDGGPMDADGVIHVALVHIRKAGWEILNKGGRIRLLMEGDKHRRIMFTRVDRMIYDAFKAAPGMLRNKDLAQRWEKNPATLSKQINDLRKKLDNIGEETLIFEDGYKIIKKEKI